MRKRPSQMERSEREGCETRWGTEESKQNERREKKGMKVQTNGWGRKRSKVERVKTSLKVDK